MLKNQRGDSELLTTVKNRNTRILTILLILMSLVVIFSFGIDSVSADSSVIYVNDTGGDDSWDGQTWTTAKKTIGSGIGAVTTGGTVNIANGTYTGPGNKGIEINKDVNIAGQSMTGTIIDAQGSGNIFTINSGVTVSLQNLTLKNGNNTGGFGGAIYNYGTLNINKCNFTGNTADIGGAIENDGGTLNVTNSIFKDNAADHSDPYFEGFGGAIDNYNGQLYAEQNIFTGNLADKGNAISHAGNNTAQAYFNIFNDPGSGREIYSDEILIATNNWWSSNDNPESKVYGNVNCNPWIVLNVHVSPNIIETSGSSIVTADLTHNSDGQDTWAMYGKCIPDGTPVTFGCDTLGTINPENATTINGKATTTFTAGTHIGDSAVNAKVDGQTVTDYITIERVKKSDIYVSPTGSDTDGDGSQSNPFQSIGEALIWVLPEGRIHISNGVYTGNKNRNMIISQNISIIGESQAGTIIDGSAGGINAQIFNINSGITITIRDLTIINAFINGKGGAISNSGALSIINCTFSDNAATDNGGAISNSGALSITNCTFTGNVATIATGDTYGGAIYNSGTCTITGSTFTGNTAISQSGNTYGGAFYNNAGTLDINFCRIFGNTANQGNAIYCAGGTVTAENNWWGSNSPDFASIINGTVDANPWLILSITASPTNIPPNGVSTVTADLTHNSDGQDTWAMYGKCIPDGTPVTFGCDTLGTVDPVNTATINGKAITNFTAGQERGIATVNATLDSETLETNIVVGSLDLVPTIIETPANPFTGLPYNVKAIVSNTGTDNAGTFKVRLYDNGVLVGEKTINGLNGESSTEILIWSWIPAIGTPGEHNLTIFVDALYEVAESDETNNNATEFVTATGRPDLIPSNLTTNATLYTGLTYPVNVTIENQGDAVSGSFNVELFDGETGLGTRNITSLGIGASTILTWYWTPAFGATGIHTLKIVTDTPDQQFEINEDNNNLTNDFNVNGRPDLVPSNLTTNATIYTGISYPVNVTIKNEGDANAGNFNVELFDGETSLGTRNITSLGIGASTILSWNWTPAFGATGTHTLKIVTDTTDQQYEFNELNNNLTSNYTVNGRADLVPSNLSTNSTLYTGIMYPVNVTVKNEGDANSGTFKVRLYDNGVLVEEKTVNGLNYGNTVDLTWDWTPAIGSPGMHTLLVAVDWGNLIYESDDENNNITANFAVTGMPDLIVLGNITTNSTGTIYTNITYTVSATVKNDRDAATGSSFKVKLFDNGTLVGEQTVNGLNAGESRTLAWSWKPLTVGSHTLLVVADSLGEIDESNENNNNNSAALTVTGRPDLVVPSSLTISGPVYTNSTHSVSATITNNGDANAGSFKVELKDGSASIGIITVEEGLAIGHSTTLTWDWPIAFGATGEHYLHLIVDTLDQQYESNETNNMLDQTISVLGRPDLVPSNLTTNGTIYTGITYPVSVKITNNGDANAVNSFKVKLYDNETLVGEQSVEGGLNIGSYTTLTWNWTPNTNGTHILKIVTDTLDTIFEINETNNNITLNKNVVSVPDLTVTSVSGPTNAEKGKPITITSTIKNQGSADASNFQVYYVLSTDQIWGGTDYILGTTTVTNLASGASSTSTNTFNTPYIQTGTYYLLCFVDRTNTVTESNETNNILASTNTINLT